MKEILKNVKMNFKLNSTVFILASVIYLFLLVIGFSLTLIIPFSDILTVIFIIAPFIFTFSYLAYKSSEREILEYKDVYKGYKEVFKKRINRIFGKNTYDKNTKNHTILVFKNNNLNNKLKMYKKIRKNA